MTELLHVAMGVVIGWLSAGVGLAGPAVSSAVTQPGPAEQVRAADPRPGSGTGPEAVTDRGPAEVSMADIIRAWRRRQRQFQTFRIEWIETRTVGAGSWNWSEYRQPGETLPPVDVMIQVRHKLVVDGRKVAWIYDGPRWSSPDKAYKDNWIIAVFDGTVFKQYWRYSPGCPAGDGIVDKASYFRYFGDSHLRPVFVACRTFEKRMGNLSLRDFTVKPRFPQGRDRLYIILEQSGEAYIRDIAKYGPDQVQRVRIWLDPRRDFVPVHLQCAAITSGSNSGNYLEDITYYYKQAPEGAWVPAEWRYTLVDGETRIASAARVTGISLAKDIQPNDFDVQFPEGTYVNDYCKGIDYIIHPGGKLEIITAENMPDWMKQQLEKESRMLGVPIARPAQPAWLQGWLRLLATVLGILLVCAAVTVAYRLFRKRA